MSSYRRSLRASAFGAATFFLVGLAALPAAAQEAESDAPDSTIFIDPDSGVRDGPALREDADPEVDTISEDDRRRVVFNLVTKGLKVTSYDNTTDLVMPSQVDVGFARAIFKDAPADLRFILFDDVKLVDRLSAHTKRRLLRKFERGELILGAEGFGRDLKKALGLITPDLYDAGTTTGGEGLWVLLHRSPNGHLNELTIAAPHDEDSLAVAFQFARDWFNRNEVFVDPAVTDGDDPWNAIHNFEWKGYVIGSFNNNNETAGTYSFQLLVYFLADAESQDTDYYRFDFGTLVGISNYAMTSSDCGWWISDQHADATVSTPNGQWWPTGFMPSTTVGSTSTSFTIGGDISTSGPEGNASYTMTYGTSDVTIEVFSNTIEEWLLWDASLVGCGNYEWYPWYSGASDAAKSTYSLEPSFIAAVPQGSLLQFTTTAQGGSDQWGFTVEKDKLDFEVLLEVTKYTETYVNAITASCNTTSCS